MDLPQPPASPRGSSKARVRGGSGEGHMRGGGPGGRALRVRPSPPSPRCGSWCLPGAASWPEAPLPGGGAGALSDCTGQDLTPSRAEDVAGSPQLWRRGAALTGSWAEAGTGSPRVVGLSLGDRSPSEGDRTASCTGERGGERGRGNGSLAAGHQEPTQGPVRAPGSSRCPFGGRARGSSRRGVPRCQPRSPCPPALPAASWLATTAGCTKASAGPSKARTPRATATPPWASPSSAVRTVRFAGTPGQRGACPVSRDPAPTAPALSPTTPPPPPPPRTRPPLRPAPRFGFSRWDSVTWALSVPLLLPGLHSRETAEARGVRGRVTLSGRWQRGQAWPLSSSRQAASTCLTPGEPEQTTGQAGGAR